MTLTLAFEFIPIPIAVFFDTLLRETLRGVPVSCENFKEGEGEGEEEEAARNNPVPWPLKADCTPCGDVCACDGGRGGAGEGGGR